MDATEAFPAQPVALNVPVPPKVLKGNSEQYKIALGDDLFRLPGGLLVGKEVIREVRLRPMNGHDEEALGTSESQASDGGMLNIALGRMVVALGTIEDPIRIRELVRELYTGDRFALLFMLYKISQGDVLPVPLECPAPGCGFSEISQFDLDELTYLVYPDVAPATLQTEIPVGYRDVSGVTHKLVTMRMLCGYDEPFLGINGGLGKLKTAILERSVTSIGPYLSQRAAEAADPDAPSPPVLITEIFRSLRTIDRNHLSQVLNRYQPTVLTSATEFCKNCNTKIPVRLDPSVLFSF